MAKVITAKTQLRTLTMKYCFLVCAKDTVPHLLCLFILVMATEGKSIICIHQKK